MNTSNLTFISKTPEDTKNLSLKIAKLIQEPVTILLSGNLGVGKTLFARAFIQHLTNSENIPSPTYSILQTYQSHIKNLEIAHFDLYRVQNEEELIYLNFSETLESSITLIEWSERLNIFKPKQYLHVNIKYLQENLREIQIECINLNKICTQL